MIKLGQVPLGKNSELQKNFQRGLLFKDFRITQRAVSTCQSIIVLDTEELIPFKVGDEMCDSGSDTIVALSNDRSHLLCLNNPASRELNLGDEKIHQNLISSH